MEDPLEFFIQLIGIGFFAGDDVSVLFQQFNTVGLGLF